ncbi:MAG TPA: Stp1/IreP family PP2C-type Ser/Thr phosphatase [Longimicrobiales bacterium]|nr:Stp1/IreP family PP2C-type Ser/Thr phosphatase [Longimicrobiales bacterium]
MALQAAVLTDRGRVRASNEDSYLAVPERALFAVADGMGGHAGGEVASRLAVDTLERALAEADASAPRERVLREALERANRDILERATRDPALAGMGTTLTALELGSDGALIAHVGDTRAYLLRDGLLDRLTVDHTLVQGYVDLGEISAAQARTHRHRHILTRALGTDSALEVDIRRADVAAGDLLLLCSDGLTTLVDDADLEAILAQPLPLGERARQLVDAANLRGGDDNVTVVLIELEGEAGPSA